jgi:hypothetical protein
MQEENAHESSSIRMQWKQLNTEQKIAIIALVIGAGFIFIYSAINVRQSIYTPFLASIEDFEKNRELIQDPVAEYEALQKRTDSDGDGLSDWAEENVYKTSPYLWSTAGDEIPDNVKIAKGENPLCRSGEACDIGAMKFDLATSSSPYDLLEDQPSTNDTFNQAWMGSGPSAGEFQDLASEAGVDLEAMKEQIPKDPATLRQAALDSGRITQEQLDNISDEDLVKLYLEAYEELEEELKQEPNQE